ncbi:MAG: hypothetical protein ACYDHY_10325 [Acidiferrobacterales bacterium]
MNKIPLIAAVAATLGFSALPVFAASTSASMNDHSSTVVSVQHRSLSRSVLEDSSTDNGSSSDQGNQSQSSDDGE